MLRRISVVCAAAVLIVLMTGVLTYAKDMKGKFGLGGYGGYSMMNIKGVNEWYDVFEERIDLFGRTTESKDYLKGGMTYGAQIKYGITSSVVLTASGGLVSSKGKLAFSGATSGVIDDRVSATFFGAGALFVLPLGSENLNLFLGGGADYYIVKYEADIAENGFAVERRAEGSKIGFNLEGGVEFFLTRNIAIGGNIVYRIVNLAEIKTTKDDWGVSAEGDPLQVFTDPFFLGTKNLEIDLGGITIGAGIRFYIG